MKRPFYEVFTDTTALSNCPVKYTNRNNLSRDLGLFTDLALDSLDIIELTGALEDEYDIEIPSNLSGNWQTIEDIAETLLYLDVSPELVTL